MSSDLLICLLLFPEAARKLPGRYSISRHAGWFTGRYWHRERQGKYWLLKVFTRRHNKSAGEVFISSLMGLFGNIPEITGRVRGVSFLSKRVSQKKFR